MVYARHGSKYVVNTLLQNGFSNPYLSRYKLDSFDYQCQHTATIRWTYNPTTTGCNLQLVCFSKDQLSKSTGTPALNQSMTINAKSMGKILNLIIKAVICTESLYQLLYLRFICYKLKLIDVITISRRYLYHMIKKIMLRITAQLK